MTTPRTIPETVHAWFGERLANGAIARNTEAYNQAVAALPDLIARLDPEAALPTPTPTPDAEQDPAPAADSIQN